VNLKKEEKYVTQNLEGKEKKKGEEG